MSICIFLNNSILEVACLKNEDCWQGRHKDVDIEDGLEDGERKLEAGAK